MVSRSRTEWRRYDRRKPQSLYSQLLSKQSEAIRRAKELRDRHQRDGNDATENPSTGMDRLVCRLSEL